VLGAVALLSACDDQTETLPRGYGGGTFGQAPATSTGGGAGGGAGSSQSGGSSGGSNGGGTNGGGADTGSSSGSQSSSNSNGSGAAPSSSQANAAIAAVGACMQQQLFDAIGFDQLTTAPDANDPNPQIQFCSDCHATGQNGFVMAVGTANDNTFAQTKTMPYVQAYVGYSGNAPAPSNAIFDKSIASQTLGSTHPRFELTPDMPAAIHAFAADAVTRWQNKQCN
jgi:hypothetical protein